MDIGRLITQSWHITWRFKYLWLLGAFIGGGSGGFNTNLNNRLPLGSGTPSGSPADLIGPNTPWATAHIGLVIAVVSAVALVVVALLIVSVIARGGLTTATLAIARDEPMASGMAWRAGLQRFWRFLGLGLFQFGIGLAVVVVVGGVVALFVLLFPKTSDVGRVVAILFGLALGFVALIGLIVGAVILSVMVPLAERAIVAEDLGPVHALRRGWQLAMARKGDAALAWVVGVGVGIGGGIAAGIPALIVVLVLGAIGFTIYFSAGLTVAFFSYLAVAVLILLVVSAFLQGVVMTYQWSYWSLAYLQLTVPRATPAVPAAPEPV